VALRDDGSRARAESLTRRRIFALTESRSLARTELRKLKEDARSRILKPSEKILKLIDQRTSQEELDSAATEVEAELERVVKEVGDDLGGIVAKLGSDLTERLDEIDGSALCQQVSAESKISLERPDISGINGGMSPKTRKLLGDGLKSGSKYLAENGKLVANALGQIYKFFGGRFRPWGKVKLGNWVGKAGKVLGPLAAVGEAYMSFREEQQKESADKKLRSIRAETRAQFADAAAQFDNALREQEDELIKVMYDLPLRETNQLVRDILRGLDDKKGLAQSLSVLAQEIRDSIDRLSH